MDFVSTCFERLSLATAVHVLPGKGEPIHKNRPSHGFAYQCDGESTYAFDNGITITVQPNTIIYLPKHSNYIASPKTPENATNGVLAINFDVSDELSIAPFKLAPRNFEQFHTLFKETEIAWRTKPTGYYELCCKYLYDILFKLKIEAAPQYVSTRKSSIIAPAVQYIHENYAYENISIAHLASLCNISEVYLRKLFHLTYSMAPIKYINALKLQRAKELIDNGEYSVGNAGLQAGFFDTSYFSREFKKAFGLSPTEYEKRKRISF